MTTMHIKPSKIQGTIKVPSSKSHTLRAIFYALMAKGKSVVHHYLQSSDAMAMIEAIRLYGATVDLFPDRLEITGVDGKLPAAENVIDCGNSGIVLRFIGALAGLSQSYTVITGDRSIRHNRPVKPLLDAMQGLGVFAVTSRLDGYAPILIKGPITPGKVTMSGEDSQPVTGMLTLCAFAKGPSEITVENAGEKPWIDLTLHWFNRLGIEVTHENYSHYRIAGNASYVGYEYTVPGDFSSAAFPIAAALVTQSEVTLTNIDMSDIQGDKQLIHTLIKMGANIEINDEKKALTIKKSPKLKGMEIDINQYIDAITILSVIACYCEGPTHIKNAAIARKKECDRIHSICTELKKMGAKVEEKDDGLIIHPSLLNGAELESYNDHRMAMSLAVAALGAKGNSTIQNAQCIAKTYPQFKDHLTLLGADIQ